MSSRRKATGSKGRRSGVSYFEGENNEDNSDVSESENETNEEESVKSKGNYFHN